MEWDRVTPVAAVTALMFKMNISLGPVEARKVPMKDIMMEKVSTAPVAPVVKEPTDTLKVLATVSRSPKSKYL